MVKVKESHECAKIKIENARFKVVSRAGKEILGSLLDKDPNSKFVSENWKHDMLSRLFIQEIYKVTKPKRIWHGTDKRFITEINYLFIKDTDDIKKIEVEVQTKDKFNLCHGIAEKLEGMDIIEGEDKEVILEKGYCE